MIDHRAVIETLRGSNRNPSFSTARGPQRLLNFFPLRKEHAS
jgi:hypothetical protein